VERFSKFRSEHPSKRISVDGAAWEYLSCGIGTEVLLTLPGGLRVAEAAFSLIQMFEDTFRLIVPTYPPLGTMDEIVDGVAAILNKEQVLEAFVLGQSYGGTVAQVLIQRYPSRVNKVVMSIFRRLISSVVTVQESERVFWEAYLKELFRRRLTKADILSHFQTSRDAQSKYAYAKGEKSSWSGDVLVIWGESDHLRTERGRRGMLEIFPQAQIHVIAGGGHTVGMSKPEKYAAAVKEFYDKK
jgi:pimeloyl-ACP methyl ester carboxylesterase